MSENIFVSPKFFVIHGNMAKEQQYSWVDIIITVIRKHMYCRLNLEERLKSG